MHGRAGVSKLLQALCHNPSPQNQSSNPHGAVIRVGLHTGVQERAASSRGEPSSLRIFIFPT